MAPSGMHWRCSIAPKSGVVAERRAGLREHEELVARYSTGMQNGYFGWQDAQRDTAPQLAAKFIDRFPRIVEMGEGRDWPYAGWYVEMLGFAERGHLPVAFADWYGEAPSYVARDEERELPFPPT